MCIDSTSQETREKEIERKRNKEEVSGDEGWPSGCSDRNALLIQNTLKKTPAGDIWENRLLQYK